MEVSPTTIAQAAVSLFLLFLGGELLVRGATSLALRLGVSPLTIGLTVVAFGTSAPELVVSLDAVHSGANDISVANVVGSNVANVALILGLAMLIRPVVAEAKVVRLDAPMMIGASLLLMIMMADGGVSRIEGALLVALLVAYTAFTFWQGRHEIEPVQEELSAAAPTTATGTLVSAILVVAGLGVLVAGGHLLVTAAVELATALGVGQAAIGLTVVAVGTSLPELATSVIASFRRQGDIAVGNVVGSNLFNILGILGVTAVVHPLRRGGIGWDDLGVMLALACALMALLWTKLPTGRVAGACFVAGYAAYLLQLLDP